MLLLQYRVGNIRGYDNLTGTLIDINHDNIHNSISDVQVSVSKARAIIVLATDDNADQVRFTLLIL